MFKDERRTALGGAYAPFACVLSLVSLFSFVTAALAAESNPPSEPNAGGVVATDLDEPAEFVPAGEAPVELKLDLQFPAGMAPPAQVPDEPGAEELPLTRATGSSLAQPHSIGGMQNSDGRPDRISKPKLLSGASHDATPQEIEEVQQQIAAAHELAKSASSSAEYTAIVELCGQGESSTTWSAGKGYFRRLAAWAYNRRGEERVGAGQEADALEDFHQALKLDPRNWRAAHNRGVSYAQQGELTAAVRDFADTIRIQPDYGPAYRNRGEVYFEMGRYADAIADYTRALTFMPDRDELYFLRADAHYRGGRLEEALADYNAAIEADQRPNRLVGRSGVHAAVGDYAAAIGDLNLAIKLDPRDAEAYRAVAWILATCPDPQYRRPDKALVAARYALKLEGNHNPHYYDTLAAAYAAAENFDQAASIQQHAVSLAAGTADQELLETRLALYRQHRPVTSNVREVPRTVSRPAPEPPRSRPGAPAGVRQPLGSGQMR